MLRYRWPFYGIVLWWQMFAWVVFKKKPSFAEAVFRTAHREHNYLGILYGDTVCRLVGVGDDGEDYYYITVDESGYKRWSSMVGAWDSLRGWHGYDYLERNTRIPKSHSGFIVERIGENKE